jgi:hypothetical protein
VTMKNAVFWDVALVPRSWIFLPWRWKRYVPPKRRFTQDIHGATSQNTAFFIVYFVYLFHFFLRLLNTAFFIVYFVYLFHFFLRLL